MELKTIPTDNDNIVNSIRRFELNDIPPSSFSILLGKRRSGKSYLTEDLIQKMIKNKMLDMVLLFSGTDSGFSFIDKEFRFGGDMDKLNQLVDNLKHITEYNSVAPKKDQIKANIAVIIDDHAVSLKSREFNILETLAVNGRHFAKPPLSLHIYVLAQSLTKIPKVVRLNADLIFFNSIASMREREIIFDENLYMLESDIHGRRKARHIYDKLVVQDDFVFVCILNCKQNVKEYSDYLVTYKAE